MFSIAEYNNNHHLELNILNQSINENVDYLQDYVQHAVTNIKMNNNNQYVVTRDGL